MALDIAYLHHGMLFSAVVPSATKMTLRGHGCYASAACNRLVGIKALVQRGGRCLCVPCCYLQEKMAFNFGNSTTCACAICVRHDLHVLLRAASEPTRYPAGSTAAASDSHFAEDQPGSHAELYGGPSRDSVRNGSHGTSRRHSRGAIDPRGNAVHSRGSTVHPRGSAAGPRGGQRAAARGRGDQRRGRSAGRSTGHIQQTRGSHSPQQTVSVSSRNRVKPAVWPKGQHAQPGSNQGPHRQSRRPANKADVATFLYAQQSGYPC